MKKNQIYQLLFLFFLTVSCEKNKEMVTEIKKGFSFEKVSGYVQKGPYLNGTAITLSELSAELIPTGKNYPAQILDNKGTFEVKNVELLSQYIEIKAEGFYFNEVANSNSPAQLTLFAFSDLTNKAGLNINVLSNLEKGRVELLIDKGLSFSDAKKKAQGEVLSIFKISKADILFSEDLDITKSGDDNAILLAVSVILQGYLSVSDLSELMANISTDIREDGILNSQTLGTALINNARSLKLDKIRSDIEARYETLGLSIIVPEFEKYVRQFIANTDFVFTGGIKYPEKGKYGINILDNVRTDYSTGIYSMKAILPEGTSLNVKILGEFHWYYSAFQSGTGWNPSDWSIVDNSRTFSTTQTGEVDFQIRLEHFENSETTNYTNKIKIEVSENEATLPTWEKVINIK